MTQEREQAWERAVQIDAIFTESRRDSHARNMGGYAPQRRGPDYYRALREELDGLILQHHFGGSRVDPNLNWMSLMSANHGMPPEIHETTCPYLVKHGGCRCERPA